MTYFTLNFYFSRRKKYMNFRSSFSFNDIPIFLSLSRYRSPFDATTPSTFDPSFQPPSINHHPHQKFPLLLPVKNSPPAFFFFSSPSSTHYLLLLPPSSTDRASSPRTQWPTVIARAREELEGDGPTKRS